MPVRPAGARRGRRRKRQRRILGYDDLLGRLAAALAGRTRRLATGCGAAGRSCWSTSSRTPTRCSGRSCDRAFAGHATMVLVGDPKQSIYAFRGGDVETYLAAARTAETHGRR